MYADSPEVSPLSSPAGSRKGSQSSLGSPGKVGHARFVCVDYDSVINLQLFMCIV